jgi:hypothetical protein
MAEEKAVDYYELLQVSASAEPETINRVYRLLAQRYHPDNRETGDEGRFREICGGARIAGASSRPARRLKTTSSWNSPFGSRCWKRSTQNAAWNRMLRGFSRLSWRI